jgi:hypothetical protein
MTTMTVGPLPFRPAGDAATLVDRFHETDHIGCDHRFSLTRVSQQHLGDPILASIRFEPWKRPTRLLQAGGKAQFHRRACVPHSHRRIHRTLHFLRALKPPSGPDWVHEVKHDGYQLIVRRAGSAVRLFTRRGYDWSDRYPAIAGAAAKLKAQSFTLDGEAVCGADGIAIFDALHRHGTVDAARAFLKSEDWPPNGVAAYRRMDRSGSRAGRVIF